MILVDQWGALLVPLCSENAVGHTMLNQCCFTFIYRIYGVHLINQKSDGTGLIKKKMAQSLTCILKAVQLPCVIYPKRVYTPF